MGGVSVVMVGVDVGTFYMCVDVGVGIFYMCEDVGEGTFYICVDVGTFYMCVVCGYILHACGCGCGYILHVCGCGYILHLRYRLFPSPPPSSPLFDHSAVESMVTCEEKAKRWTDLRHTPVVLPASCVDGSRPISSSCLSH